MKSFYYEHIKTNSKFEVFRVLRATKGNKIEVLGTFKAYHGCHKGYSSETLTFLQENEYLPKTMKLYDNYATEAYEKGYYYINNKFAIESL